MELSIGGDQTQKFSSIYLVEQINVFRKQEKKQELLHKNLLAKIESEFEDEIGGQNFQPTSYLDKSNRNSKMYELDFKQSLQILMSESKFVRKAVIDILEKQQQEIKRLTVPLTFLEAMKLVVEKEEQRLLAESNVEKLNVQLDNLLEYISIIKVAQFNKISENVFDWRLLKQQSLLFGYEIKKAESNRYRFQNLYHIDCFKSCYPQFKYNFTK